MRKQGKKREKIERKYLAVLAGLSAAVLWLAVGNIVVLAAPVSLESPSAVVYEQTSEGSNAVGNLIQDSTFDYQGDVRAEDGSTWHMVTMANGVSGYIRGDLVLSPVENVETETGAGAEGGETGTDPQTGNGETGADAGAENGETGVDAGAEQGATGADGAGAAGEEAAEDENTADEDADGGQEGEEDALAGNITPPVYGAENNREKTYAAGALGTKIKQSESVQEPEEVSESPVHTDFFGRLDKTLIFSGIVLICAFLVGRAFLKKLKEECIQPGESVGDILKGSARRYDKKSVRRKRKNRRRKNKRKKQQAKKENEKTYKTSNGKRSGYTQSRKE